MPVGEAAGGRSPLGSSARRARPTCSEIAILSAVGPPNAAGPSPSRGGGCSSAGSTRSSCSSSRNTTSPSTSRVDGTPAPAAGGARPTCSEAGAREMAACGGVALRRRQPPSRRLGLGRAWLRSNSSKLSRRICSSERGHRHASPHGGPASQGAYAASMAGALASQVDIIMAIQTSRTAGLQSCSWCGC